MDFIYVFIEDYYDYDYYDYDYYYDDYYDDDNDVLINQIINITELNFI